ncbi:MAG: hypothetical protein ACRERE_25370 [Candidatus Entotheonellia bacterium]
MSLSYFHRHVRSARHSNHTPRWTTVGGRLGRDRMGMGEGSWHWGVEAQARPGRFRMVGEGRQSLSRMKAATTSRGW